MKDIIMNRLLCFCMGGVLIVAITGCASHPILDSFSEDANHSFREVRMVSIAYSSIHSRITNCELQAM